MMPARSDIAALLCVANLRPALLGLELVRGDGDVLRNAMRTRAQHADVLVCDAETDDDLRRIAEASMVLGRGTVWAGSGGTCAASAACGRVVSRIRSLDHRTPVGLRACALCCWQRFVPFRGSRWRYWHPVRYDCDEDSA